MSIKLDWEIETEGSAYTGLGEHPLDVRRRRTVRRQTLVAILLIAGVVAVLFGGFLARLYYVQSVIEGQLRDTVAAEAAALRIGDIAGYLYVQRSESDAWMLGQTNLFWQYQQLKQEHDVQLAGRVLDIEVDENRARALVEEIIDGQRYQVVWFYWRYEDGWRHAPLDSTFWGGEEVYGGPDVTVTYGRLDEPLVEALLPALERLWGVGCEWLACPAPLPSLAVRVLPDAALGVMWSPDEANTLLITSPLTNRARVDVPLEPDLQHRIGAALAERLLDHAKGGLRPRQNVDAAFLYDALENWLVGRFLGDGGALGSGFVESLSQNYGQRTVGLLAQAVQPDSSIAVLSTVLATPLETLNVDWREFFQWRLALEPFLLSQGDQAAFLGLYDTDYPDIMNEAMTLINDPVAASGAVPTVLRVVTGLGTDGIGRAWVVIQRRDGGEEVLTFRAVGNYWWRSVPDPAYFEYAQ